MWRLVEDPIPINELKHSMTQKCCSKELVCSDDSHRSLGRRSQNASLVIFCSSENVVKKYYDRDYHHVPCNDAIANIPDAKFCCEDASRYQILEYPYLTGCHKLKDYAQVVAAIRALDNFHAKNYVHGDIRESNMIVCKDVVYFVDVDFADKEGNRYPSIFKLLSDMMMQDRTE